MLFLTIVLDGVGIGAQPDAGTYGDAGSHTLGHVCEVAHPHLPNLEKLGLGCIEPLAGIRAVPHPEASFGKMTETSAGKDSTTGHWELAGIRSRCAFSNFSRWISAGSDQQFPGKNRMCRRTWKLCCLRNGHHRYLWRNASADSPAHRLYFGRQCISGCRTQRCVAAGRALPDL